MKQLVLLVIFVAIGTTLSGCVSTGPMQSVVSAGEAEKITEEITELARQWGRVPITKDIDHLKRILADDFSLVTPDGNVIDKEDWIALIEKDIKEKTNRSLALNIQSSTCAFMGKTLLLRMVLPMP
jgi:hypothetical protein